MLRDATVAVTGSSGFVGSHLVKKLSELNVRVIGLDIRDGVDLTDWTQIRDLPPFDTMIHLAAKIFVPAAYENPREFYYINIGSTINALEICRTHEAKMVFASSYVYGQPKYLPIDEAHPVSVFNPYCRSKVVGESLCEGYHRDFGIRVLMLRAFNLYGPGQDKRTVIPSIIDQAETGRILLKDPQPRRDFVYIDDMVDAYVKAIQYEATSFETFNIAGGTSYSIKQIAETIARRVGDNIKVEFTGERRKNEVMDTVADITKAKKLLAWQPKTGIEEGINLCLRDTQ
jgi:nucleoside-diphosphate-sugar epimerase